MGTILKVTPHINEGNSVQLKIEQEDSSPGAKLTDSADISTNKRSIKTTVLIEDGGIIVLGGLMSDTVTESEDRVPGLGAIPLIGNLFKSRSGSRQKKNLLVFIRPQHHARRGRHRKHQRGRRTMRCGSSQHDLNGGHITLLPGQKQPAVPAIIPQGVALPPPPDANPQGATPNPPEHSTAPLTASCAAGAERAAPPGATPAAGTPPPP